MFIPNVFSPNQDGENDLWEVTASKVNSLNIQVFNRWGEQVYIFNSQNLQSDTSTAFSVTYSPAWDGHTPTGKPVPKVHILLHCAIHSTKRRNQSGKGTFDVN